MQIKKSQKINETVNTEKQAAPKGTACFLFQIEIKAMKYTIRKNYDWTTCRGF